MTSYAERWPHAGLGPAQVRGVPENPLTDDELRGKYRELAEPMLGAKRTARIESWVGAVTTDAGALSSLVGERLSGSERSA